MLKPGSDPEEGDEALKHYANHTAQIEVKDCSLNRNCSLVKKEALLPTL